MYNVSEYFNEDIHRFDRKINIKLSVNGEAIEKENLLKVTIERAVTDGTSFTLGQTFSSKVEIELYKCDIEFKQGDRVDLSLLLETDKYQLEEPEEVPQGVYYIDKVEVNGVKVKLTAFDLFYTMEEEYSSTIEYPTTTKKLMAEITSKCGFKHDSTLEDITIVEKLEGYTAKELIGFIAGIQGKNAIINHKGEISFVDFTKVNYQLDPSSYITFTKENNYKITGVTCLFGDVGINSGDLTGNVLAFKNPWCKQSDVDRILKKFKGLTLTNANVRYIGNFGLLPSDIITLQDKEGTIHNLFISKHIISYGGGITGEIVSGCEDKADTSHFVNKIANKKTLTELTIEQGKINAEIVEINKQANSTIEKMAQLEITAEGINQRVERTEQSITTNSNNIASANGLISTLQTGLNTTNNNLSATNNTVSNLSTQVTTNKKNIASINTTVDSITQQVGQTEEKIETIEGSITGINVNVSGIVGDITGLNNSLNTANTNISNAIKNLNALKGEVDGVTDDLGEFGDDLGALSGVVDGVIVDIEDIQGSVTSNSEKIASIKTNVDSITQTVSNTEKNVTTLSGKITTANNNISSLQSGLNSTNGNVTGLQTGLNATNSNLTALDKTVTNINATVESNKNQIASIVTNVDSITQTVSNTEKNVTTLSGTITATNKNVSALQTGLNGANTNISNLQTGLSGANTNISTLQSGLSSANQNVSNLQNKLNTTNSNVSNLQNGLNTTNGNVSALNTTVTNINAQVESNKSQIASIKTDVSGITQTVSNTEKTVTTLSGTVTQTNKDLSSLSGKVDNINIGGRNYWKHSSGDMLKDNTTLNEHWYATRGKIKISSQTMKNGIYLYMPYDTQNTNSFCSLKDTNKRLITIPKGTEVSLSCDIVVGGNCNGYKIRAFNNDDGEKTSTTIVSETATPKNKKLKVTFNMPYDNTNFYIYNEGVKSSTNTMESNLIFNNIMLTIGNKVLDWTPAPEDTTEEIGKVDVKVESNKTQLATLSTTLNSITQRVESTESTTTTLNTTLTNTNKNLSTLQTNLGTANTNINNLQSGLNTANNNITTNKNNIATANNNITTNKNNIATNKTNIANLTTTVTNTSTKVATIETNLNGITSKVSSLESTTSSLNGTVTSHENRLKTAENKITDSAIINTVSSTIQSAKNDAINSANSNTANQLKNYATTSSLTQTANSITASFKSRGAYNLVKNGNFANDLKYWTPETFSGSGIQSFYARADSWTLPNKKALNIQVASGTGERTARQEIPTTVGQKYTLSYYIAGHRSNKRVRIRRGDNWGDLVDHVYHGSITGGETIGNWVYNSITFTAQTTSTLIWFDLYEVVGSDGYIWLHDVCVVEGDTPAPFTPHPSEIYEGSTIIDGSGITVNNGALRVKNSRGTTVLEGDSNGDLTLNGRVVNGSDVFQTRMEKGGLTYRIGDEDVATIRTVRNDSNHYINGLSIAMMPNGDYLDLGYTESTSFESSVPFYTSLRISKGSAEAGGFNGVQLYSNMQFRTGKHLYFSDGTAYDHEIFASNNNRLTMMGNDGFALGYKEGDTRRSLITGSETDFSTGAKIYAHSGFNMGGNIITNSPSIGNIHKSAIRISNINAYLDSGWYSFDANCVGLPVAKWGILLHIDADYGTDFLQMLFLVDNTMRIRWWVNGAYTVWKTW